MDNGFGDVEQTAPSGRSRGRWIIDPTLPHRATDRRPLRGVHARGGSITRRFPASGELPTDGTFRGEVQEEYHWQEGLILRNSHDPNDTHLATNSCPCKISSMTSPPRMLNSNHLPNPALRGMCSGGHRGTLAF